MLDDDNCDIINMCVLLGPLSGYALRMFLAYARDDLHHLRLTMPHSHYFSMFATADPDW